MLRVVDGDTVHLDVDLGFGVHEHLDIRLDNINAPEIKTPEGQTAAAHLAMLLSPPSALVIRTRHDRQEKWGRWLATIQVGVAWVEGASTVNDQMVGDGQAVPYHGGKR